MFDWNLQFTSEVFHFRNWNEQYQFQMVSCDTYLIIDNSKFSIFLIFGYHKLQGQDFLVILYLLTLENHVLLEIKKHWSCLFHLQLLRDWYQLDSILKLFSSKSHYFIGKYLVEGRWLSWDLQKDSTRHFL